MAETLSQRCEKLVQHNQELRDKVALLERKLENNEKKKDRKEQRGETLQEYPGLKTQVDKMTTEELIDNSITRRVDTIDGLSKDISNLSQNGHLIDEVHYLDADYLAPTTKDELREEELQHRIHKEKNEHRRE